LNIIIDEVKGRQGEIECGRTGTTKKVAGSIVQTSDRNENKRNPMPSNPAPPRNLKSRERELGGKIRT